MRPILAGIETEYGLSVEGRGIEDQIQDSMALVRSVPGECFVGWDYRYESPRADLRGFTVESLTVDPVDAAIDAGRAALPSQEERADRVLANGARFYNDHGHPEYATPESFSAAALARLDVEGEETVLSAAAVIAKAENREVRIYKNNTDFHGASFGTHESYLVPRSHSFEAIYEAVVPMLVARQVLTGAGKVGSEAKGPARFQLSQRADFLTEAFSVDTLFRRPVFNTRDEPHADPAHWVRLHVICGDANMNPRCSWRKVALVKLALWLLDAGAVPLWRIPDPVTSFQLVSRDSWGEGRIELEGANWTTPRQVIESYLEAGASHLPNGLEKDSLLADCATLLEQRHGDFDRFRRSVDWASKRWLMEQFMAADDLNWHDPALRSVDLAYHLLDDQESLYTGMVLSGEIDDALPLEESGPCTRASARAWAIEHFRSHVRTMSWGSIVFDSASGVQEVRLRPDVGYPAQFRDVSSIEGFIAELQEISDSA